MKVKNMTDRELLELAAKAAGVVLEDEHYWRDGFWTRWNPLVDDGDALRLAVALCMSLLIGQGGTVAAYIDNDDLSFEAIEHYLPDGNAATRRAIVCAAAEIGKELK